MIATIAMFIKQAIIQGIPLLYGSVRRRRELFEHGRKVARGESTVFDYSPPDITPCERCFKVATFVSIAVAAVTSLKVEPGS